MSEDEKVIKLEKKIEVLESEITQYKAAYSNAIKAMQEFIDNNRRHQDKSNAKLAGIINNNQQFGVY